MSIFRYSASGSGIAVDGRTSPDRCIVSTWDCDGNSETPVPAAEVPAVARGVAEAMHQAAGLPAPVILERPEPCGTFEFEGVALTIRPGSGVDATRLTGHGTQSGTLYLPETMRRIAARFAALADEAKNAPDPAEVEELAEAIRAEIHPGYTVHGLRPSESDRAAARAALRWMRDKQQRGEGRDA